jgi:hypothetical protein
MSGKAYLPGKRTIAVETVLNDKTLTIQVRMSRDLRRFFCKNHFYIRYEQEIDADEGTLSIPAVALLLPLAWLTGSNIHVRCLNKAFAEAVKAVQEAYRRIYPKIPFGTELIVEQLTNAPPNPEGSAMLFSGGLDATYSYFANRHLNPRLIQIFGTEFPLSDKQFLELLKNESLVFAEQHNADLSFINTNYFYLLDQRALIHAFTPVCELTKGSLWTAMGYVIGFLSMTAPLAAGRFNHMMIAAAVDKEHADRMRENPDASSPRLDQKITWSNLRVEHHGCLHRYEKVREMKDWLPGTPLRVCWMFEKAQEIEQAMNCNRCEKCARTIVALAIGGVDPGQCGFVIDEGTIEFMKKKLSDRKLKKGHLALWWGPMQREIPDCIEGDMFRLREFMEWFRTFDLGNGMDSPISRISMRRLYSLFPYPVAFRT